MRANAALGLRATSGPGTSAQFRLMEEWRTASQAHMEAWARREGRSTPLELIGQDEAALADLERQREDLSKQMITLKQQIDRATAQLDRRRAAWQDGRLYEG
jgi:ferric-dicitrate binding protein FerR (iron transport regulator)